ncbi:TerD family protein [Aureibacter tunicatorum]|uniref:Tellurium resistance protein TerZ n=1 Tax=Aureibacter tunicatorum TaxID=866807 RepID=A0AAE4BU71_9BACT|nr:TerD family protein [Aureibacter tunicatorum]MDR6240402.1 tellurium resistance protein TerZ [Aureibacter tunicatorum]BDD05718.1 tellurium resistance protein TerZ [Aureibacter tunicatorum]
MAVTLVKGQKINLVKPGTSGANTSTALKSFCVGLNWGAIEIPADESSFFGIVKKAVGMTGKKVEVDLDASCLMVDKNGKVVDFVFYGDLKSKDRAIIHSGDDLTGDMDGDDGLDNEVITVNLPKINPATEQVFFFLNSYKKQDFAEIPFAKIRMYEGTPSKVNKVFATFDVAGDSSYAGYVSMIMGKLYRRNGEWKFHAIGDPIKERDYKQTINKILKDYV